MTGRRACVALLLLAFEAGAYEGVSRPETPPEAPSAPPALTKAPALLESREPHYPEALQAEGVGGEVLLAIDIDAEGSVSRAEVMRSSGHVELDAAAVRALVLFRFSPAEFDHVPTAVRVEYLQHFVPAMPVVEEPEEEAPVNLRGQLRERGTRTPIAGATVYLPDAELVTTTDEEGRFEVRGVPIGEQRIEIRELRYRPFDTVQSIVEGEVTELNVYVWKRVENGFEVTVRGERPKTEVARRTLEKAELKTVPGTFGDPIRVVQSLPGVARAPYVGGQLLVRGAAPEDTGVYIDGVPIPLLFHFAGGPSVINPGFIDRIDFFPGAYGARYGRAIAGILDVTTSEPKAKALHGEFDIDFLDAGFFLEGPVGDGGELGSWAIAARRSYIDTFLPFVLDAVRPEGGANFVASPAYWDYQGRYDRRIGKNRLELMIFGSNDTLVGALAGDAETQGFAIGSRQGFHRLRVGWSRLLDSGWALKVAPTVGYTVQSFDLASGDSTLGGSLEWFSVNTRATATKEFSKALTLEVGLESNLLFYDVALMVPEPPPFFPFPGQDVEMPITERVLSTRGASNALYVEAVWSPFERLRLIPGLRAELYELPEQWLPSVEPRLAARLALTDATTLKAGWGLYRQNPQPQDLDAEFGNPWLGLLRSNQSVVGVEHRVMDGLSVDVQAFFNLRSNLRSGGRALIEVEGEERFVNGTNDGRGRAYGLEVLVKKDLTERMFGWVAYTLSRSEFWSETREKYLPVNFDQTHILSAVASYKWDYGIETGLRFRLTTGRPDSAVLGATYDADTNGYRAISSDFGSIRGATFHQLDLRVEKQWTFEAWRFSTYLDIQNLYNAENPEFVVWDYRYAQSASVRGLPFLPTLGVTGAF